jgi:hypothetical protein
MRESSCDNSMHAYSILRTSSPFIIFPFSTLFYNSAGRFHYAVFICVYVSFLDLFHLSENFPHVSVFVWFWYQYSTALIE